MSLAMTPSKRPYDRTASELNGRGKWLRSGSFEPQQHHKKSACLAVFRLLCPSSKSGSVIGKGGSIVAHIRQETGACVRIEEAVPGCNERVIVVIGSDKDVEFGGQHLRENNIGSENDDGVDAGNINSDKRYDGRERGGNAEDTAEDGVPNDMMHGKEGVSAQKALLLVFDRIATDDYEMNDRDKESEKSSGVTARLLVLSSQVGCLLGKGGSVIKRMTAESGAYIKILPRAKLPPCALPLEELVQISGAMDAVRKALQSVSQQILDNPPRDPDSFSATTPRSGLSHPFAPLPHPDIFPPNYHLPPHRVPYVSGPKEASDYHLNAATHASQFNDSIISRNAKISPEMLTFRLLCPNEKVGGIIGKGGFIVKSIQRETGADIRVLEGAAVSDDRIIAVSALARPDERVSAAQDAVIRVQSRITCAVPDNNKQKTARARLLISSYQTGCLIGKGGAIMSEMRKASGAHICILGRDHAPKCASDFEEVVEITGELDAVQEALLHVTTRLRDSFFHDKYPSADPPSGPDFFDQVPPLAPYMGRRDPLPPGTYPTSRSSIHKFDSHSDIPPRDDRAAYASNLHRSGLTPPISDRTHSPASWLPQGAGEGNVSIGLSDYATLQQRRASGFGGGSQSAIITSTTVEVVVPRALVPSIYGEEGGCLKQIREISGAKITITEPRPGITETVVIISGAPDQTHAAQSLLQAFVICGTSSP